MWKTGQQTAASMSFRPSAELDFPPFPQRLWKIAHCSLKKGAKESSICALTSCPNRSQTRLPWVCFSSDDNYTREQCFWRENVSQSVTVSVKLLSLLTEKPCGPPNAVSSEVCVCSSTQCVSLIASRPWWVAVLTSWKKFGYYWYS